MLWQINGQFILVCIRIGRSIDRYDPDNYICTRIERKGRKCNIGLLSGMDVTRPWYRGHQLIVLQYFYFRLRDIGFAQVEQVNGK